MEQIATYLKGGIKKNLDVLITNIVMYITPTKKKNETNFL